MNSTSADGGHIFDIFSKLSKGQRYKTFYEYFCMKGGEMGQDQPFNTIDLADVLWKAQMWRENFPNVFPYYAVKAYSDPVLLRLFVLLGYGFDCSTEGEIKAVLKAQGDPKKIIFAHTIKTPRGLKYASSVGCALLTFDSKEELLKIHKQFPEANLILRIKSPSTQTVYNLSTKFGCEAHDAEYLLSLAKQLNFNVVGVSFHVGALCENPKTFTATIDKSRLVFETAKRIGYNFTIMDIGAGFFGSKEREEFFYELSQKINDSLETNFPDKTVKFIAEPGCYFVGSSVTLATTVIGKRKRLEKDKRGSPVQREYFINDGLYGSFFEHKELYDIRPKALISTSEMNDRILYQSKIWGQTCCAQDMVMEECSLPDMNEGELILWGNMGAYRRVRCSTFTEVPLPATKYVFVHNSRLRLDWLTNFEEIASYIAEVADIVEEDFITEEKEINCHDTKDM
ncbi:hypothetical protein JTE90_015103 [Oedothorax gibbosus]|uniref:Orn/DAP/Arg decarboxylase 2 N-terminal domain-containing protein n=1 Tax=Oedothorax gibbosus TaxID=931172 RepID=A0AAV6VQI4_9ARAC|nr:hypothetical protein JTE90_015103 [Oedothorax gibbosus]